jgi:hypothetical protein
MLPTHSHARTVAALLWAARGTLISRTEQPTPTHIPQGGSPAPVRCTLSQSSPAHGRDGLLALIHACTQPAGLLGQHGKLRTPQVLRPSTVLQQHPPSCELQHVSRDMGRHASRAAVTGMFSKPRLCRHRGLFCSAAGMSMLQGHASKLRPRRSHVAAPAPSERPLAAVFGRACSASKRTKVTTRHHAGATMRAPPCGPPPCERHHAGVTMRAAAVTT